MAQLPRHGSAPGLFITLEGLDGVGKSTQLERLAAWLRGLGREVRVTAEPDGTPLGEAIRSWLGHAGATAPCERAEALLFLAARAQHVETVIKPALAAGATVLCSRYYHSTIAYQCYGLGLDEAIVRAADRWARDGLEPDGVLLFDAPAEALTERLAGRTGGDRIEARSAEFRDRVRRGFLELAAQQPERVAIIEAGGGPEEVEQRVRAVVEGWL